MSKIPPQQLHIPVLLESVLEQLAPRPHESYCDLTAGYGGHARAIVAKTQAPEKTVLVDRDTEALASLDDLKATGARLVH
ncbi:MAG TPA: 16S rRNA (cytosine(1402)-N(4))-methyltransferase, partial [Candidatus Saccharibacteria bacterium]|nr:16S rRNA (cytosine(1402)-N(4))-methyltransferase [Candidatus Saccharibacteria bacterium]